MLRADEVTVLVEWLWRAPWTELNLQEPAAKEPSEETASARAGFAGADPDLRRSAALLRRAVAHDRIALWRGAIWPVMRAPLDAKRSLSAREGAP